MRFLTLLFCFLPTLTLAESPDITPYDILDFATTDLTGNGVKEHISLYNMDGLPIFSIYQRRKDDSLGNFLFSQGFATSGGPFREPSLSLGDNGSVKIHSFGPADGREEWEKTLTVAYRTVSGEDVQYVDEDMPRYVTVGLKYEWNHDGNPDDRRICDINLVSRVGELIRGPNRQVTIFQSPIGVEITYGWPVEITPEECFAD